MVTRSLIIASVLVFAALSAKAQNANFLSDQSLTPYEALEKTFNAARPATLESFPTLSAVQHGDRKPLRALNAGDGTGWVSLKTKRNDLSVGQIVVLVKMTVPTTPADLGAGPLFPENPAQTRNFFVLMNSNTIAELENSLKYHNSELVEQFKKYSLSGPAYENGELKSHAQDGAVTEIVTYRMYGDVIVSKMVATKADKTATEFTYLWQDK